MHVVQLMPLHPKTPSFLPCLNTGWFYLIGTSLPRLSWKSWSNKTVQENTDKQTRYKSEKVNNLKYSKNITSLVQLPLTTLSQETRWAYSTTPLSPHIKNMTEIFVCVHQHRHILPCKVKQKNRLYITKSDSGNCILQNSI